MTGRIRPMFLVLGSLLSLLAAAAIAQGITQLSPAALTEILAPPLPTPAAGAARFDVTVIEYFDYNCPVCRRVEPELRQLLASDPGVRLIRKDWPVFGAASVYAAYCSFAAARLGKYETAHAALIGSKQDLDTKEDVQQVLRQAGLDVAKIDADIALHQKEYSAVLTRNQQETSALGLRGTPGLIVGDRLVPGGLDFAQLSQLVRQTRKAH